MLPSVIGPAGSRFTDDAGAFFSGGLPMPEQYSLPAACHAPRSTRLQSHALRIAILKFNARRFKRALHRPQRRSLRH